MNDKIVLIQTNRVLNNENLMAQHDQSKIISNEPIYNNDSRYTVY